LIGKNRGLMHTGQAFCGLAFTVHSLVFLLFLFFISPCAVAKADHTKTKVAINVTGNRSINQGTTARGDTLPSFRIREIIVTARRISVPIADVAQSVSVLKRGDIEWTLSNSSTNLAGALPGVFVEKTGEFGRSDVAIRGLGSNGRRSTVMVDGRPEKMALFGCTITHSFLLHDVEKMEVVRGPASLVYGSGAMGGVLNIITRSIDAPFGVELKTGYGSYNTTTVTGRVSGSRGRFSASASGDYRKSDGHVDHSKYEGKDFHLKGEFKINDHIKISSSGKYFDGFKEEPLRATDPSDEVSNTWNDYRRGSFDIGLSGNAGEVDVRAMYYRNFGEHEFSDGWHSKDATDGAFLHITAKPRKSFSLNGGVDYSYQWGKLLSEPAGEWSKWEAGVYLEGEVELAHFATVSAGARYDMDKVSGNILVPSYGLILKPMSKTTVRLFASKGFRAPQINELYMFPSSNEELEAETVWDYEVGIRQEISDIAFIDLTVFKMDGQNLITLKKNATPPPMFRFVNSGSFTFKGVETSIYVSPWRYLDCSLSYTYMDVGEMTMGRPGRKLDASVSLKLKGNVLRATITHVGDYYAEDNHEGRIGSYTLCNLFGETRFAKSVAVYAGVNNLFNEYYEIYTDIPGGLAGLYEMPRRNFVAGIKIVY